MIYLKDSIEIKAAPAKVFERVFQCMTDRDAYLAWHPEHVDLCWVKGGPCVEGSIMYIEEYIQGDLLKIKFRIVRIIPGKLIDYRPLFPLSLIATGNRFIFESIGDDGCKFTAEGKIRFPEWLFRKMHKKHEYKLEATAKHMKEEGENLKRVLES